VSVAPHVERSSLQGGITTAVAPPPNWAGSEQADRDYPHRRVDVGLWSYAGPYGSRRWSSGILRVPRVFEGLSQGDSAYHDIGAHHGPIGTEGVRRALCLARERGFEALHGKHGDDYVVSQWVSKSPAVMAELHRLHCFCGRYGLTSNLHDLPSALKLFADRLSKRRRFVDFLPSLGGVPDRWWLGDSEHDLKVDWGKVELLHPPLEILPLVHRKARQDQFRGLMLVPCWPKNDWHQQLLVMNVLSCALAPDP
jgi:hypothetical protein